MTSTYDDGKSPKRHAAGLFDIRNIIGALLGIYGVILLLVAIFGNSGRSQADKPDSHANLWMGVALLVAGLFFLAWARIRPIVVDEVELARDRAEGESGPDQGSTMQP
jgi:hypothetical protein